MSYIADTLNNLIHQTAFFNITGWKCDHDSCCLYISLSCYRKAV